jgi:hypothetical protein
MVSVSFGHRGFMASENPRDRFTRIFLGVSMAEEKGNVRSHTICCK